MITLRPYTTFFTGWFTVLTLGTIVLPQLGEATRWSLARTVLPHALHRWSPSPVHHRLFTSSTPDVALREWLDFFANAHKKTPEDVEKLHTPEVKQAYERMKLSNFPHELRRSYIDASNDYALYSQRIARERAEGREEGREEGRVEGAREEREKLLEKITDLVKSG